VVTTESTVNSIACIITSNNYILIEHLYLITCDVLMMIEVIGSILIPLLVARVKSLIGPQMSLFIWVYNLMSS
jgi:hypothetical protein